MTDREKTYHGSCLCQRVRYRATGPLAEMSHCHCVDCRKAHGAAFATFIEASRTGFSFVQGANNLQRHTAESGAIRSFCRTCGSILIWERNETSKIIGVAAGTLDTPLEQKPETHFFVRSKVPWFEIRDGLPQHAAYPEPEK